MASVGSSSSAAAASGKADSNKEEYGEYLGESPTAELLRKSLKGPKRIRLTAVESSTHPSVTHQWPPVTIDKITVSGNQRTKVEYFERELEDVKRSRDKKVDIVGFYQSLQKATSDMQNQDIFEAVHVNVDTRLSPKGDQHHVDVQVNVKEKGIPFLKAESSVKSSLSSSSASLNAEVLAALRNPFGYGEVLKMSLGSNNPTTFQPAERYVSVYVPKAFRVPPPTQPDYKYADTLLHRPYDVQVSAKINDENSAYFLGFKQRTEALLAELRTRDGNHRFELEIANRDEIPLVQSILEESSAMRSGVHRTIPEVLQNVSSSTKVSLKYGFTVLNTLDSLCNPGKGSLLKGNVELATPLGSAQFLKSDWSASTHKSFGPPLFGSSQGLTLSLCSSLGLLLPFGFVRNLATGTGFGHSFSRGHDSVHLADRYRVLVLSCSDCMVISLLHVLCRYHLGGPMSLRGFDLFGVGDKAAVVRGLARRPNVTFTRTRSDDDTNSEEDFELTPSTTTSLNALGSTFSSMTSSVCRSDGVSVGSFGRFTLLGLASVPIPIRALASAGAKSFLFVNAGVLGNPALLSHHHPSHLPTNNVTAMSVSNLLDKPRVSVGCGAVVPIANVARLELTYSIPLLKSGSDVIKPFQIGVGLTIN
jgi:outer membrane protein assembly factor BamA